MADGGTIDFVGLFSPTEFPFARAAAAPPANLLLMPCGIANIVFIPAAANFLVTIGCCCVS